MRFILFFLFLSSELFAQNSLDCVKEHIFSEKKASQPSIQKLKEAISELKAKNLEISFSKFFESLSLANCKRANPESYEDKLFTELVSLYISGDSHFEKRLFEYEEKYPESPCLHLFLAAHNANKQDFEKFYILFYSGFLRYPDSYLSYKTQGVLATRRALLVSDEKKRKKINEEAHGFFHKAMQAYPQDTSLHKMILNSCTLAGEDKKESLRAIFDSILSKNVKIQRSDLAFYVNWALDLGEKKHAVDLLEKAKSWYHYSRTVEELEKKVGKVNE